MSRAGPHSREVVKALRIACAVATIAVLSLLCTAPASAQSRERECVSVNSLGVEGDGPSDQPALSGDGRFVAFRSAATNLVRGDRNGVRDVFVHDCATETTERVSVASDGGDPDGPSGAPAFSADGRFVAFESDARNLVHGDTNGCTDVFVRDLAAGTTERVSVDDGGCEGTGRSCGPLLSADGRFVAFTSDAHDLVAGDRNAASDAFVHDRATGATERVSLDLRGREFPGTSLAQSISADGRLVLFWSDAPSGPGRAPWDAGDIYLRDRPANSTDRASVNHSHAGQRYGAFDGRMSADGRYITYLGLDHEPNWAGLWGYQVLVRDRTNDTVEVASRTARTSVVRWSCAYPAISSDGSTVTFSYSGNNFFAHEKWMHADVYLHPRGTPFLAFVSDGSAKGDGPGASLRSALSSDGGTIAFDSTSSDLVEGDTNRRCDVFVQRMRLCAASATTYGAGFAGTNGVPTLDAGRPPRLGRKLTLALSNSSGRYAPGLLLVGAARADVPTAWGGELLVDAPRAVVVGLSPQGALLAGDVPADLRLEGATVDLQVLELDAGAAHGVSFTAGLELVLGR
jgi:Tol biopolymer transport system component